MLNYVYNELFFFSILIRILEYIFSQKILSKIDIAKIRCHNYRLSAVFTSFNLEKRKKGQSKVLVYLIICHNFLIWKHKSCPYLQIIILNWRRYQVYGTLISYSRIMIQYGYKSSYKTRYIFCTSIHYKLHILTYNLKKYLKTCKILEYVYEMQYLKFKEYEFWK